MRVVAFWPVGLSVILLLYSWGFDDGVLDLGVARACVCSGLPFLRFELFLFCFDDTAVYILLVFMNLRIQRMQNR